MADCSSNRSAGVKDNTSSAGPPVLCELTQTCWCPPSNTQLCSLATTDTHVPYPLAITIKDRTCCHHHEQKNNCTLSRFQCVFRPRSLPSSARCGFWQRTWCFGFRMFPLAPFGEALSCSRYSPSDLTTAGLLTCCSDDVKADRPTTPGGSLWISSHTKNCLPCCLMLLLYVCWHLTHCWRLCWQYLPFTTLLLSAV